MAYQVSNICRPKMPFTVSIEWITRSQSNSMRARGQAEQRDAPPCAIEAIIECSAAGAPDISSPTSNPSTMPRSRITSSSDVLAGRPHG